MTQRSTVSFLAGVELSRARNRSTSGSVTRICVPPLRGRKSRPLRISGVCMRASNGADDATHNLSGENCRKERPRYFRRLWPTALARAGLRTVLKRFARVTSFICLGLLLAFKASLWPAWAASAVADANIESFSSGLSSALVLILASEIGDKTFFISALLAMKFSKLIVLLGSIGALGLMTAISVAIGQIFHALPGSLNTKIPFDDYAAVALLLYFGVTNIRESLKMSDVDGTLELKDAEKYLSDAQQANRSTWNSITSQNGIRLLVETFTLVFVAEWGDKSMLATIALAAAKNPYGVVVGGVLGHLAATTIAVIGGSVLGQYLSEKNARLIGGILFLVFAGLTVFGLY